MFRVLILLISLSAGGAAAWLAINMQAPAATPAKMLLLQTPEKVGEEVLVASADLAQGQTLSEDHVRWQAWPDRAINPGFIRRSARPDALEALKDSVVRSHFVAGEPIREEKLANPGSGFLSAILPSGKRAIGVRVTAENTAGGFILPNDRVDVIHTVAEDKGGGQSVNVSRTILSNIRVLAIDQKADETSGDAVAIGKTATLELSPKEAEIIAAAEASGALSLALRSTADNDEAPSASQDKNRLVRIIRSGQVQTVEIPRDRK